MLGMNRTVFAARIAVALFLIFFIVYWVGAKNVLFSFSRLHVGVLVSVFLLLFLVALLNAWNWKQLYDTQKKIPFPAMFRYYVWSWSAGFLAPGKFGEFSIAYFLKEEGIPVGNATAIALLDKLVTAAVLGSLSLAGAVLFLSSRQFFSVIALLALFFLGCFFLFFSETGRRWVKRLALKQVAQTFSGFSKTLDDMLKNHPGRLLLDAFITLLVWSISTLIGFLILGDLGERVGFIPLLLVNALSVLLGLVPISFGGIGIREGAFVVLLQAMDVSPAASATAAVTVLAIGLITSFGLSFLFTLLGKKKEGTHS